MSLWSTHPLEIVCFVELIIYILLPPKSHVDHKLHFLGVSHASLWSTFLFCHKPKREFLPFCFCVPFCFSVVLWGSSFAFLYVVLCWVVGGCNRPTRQPTKKLVFQGFWQFWGEVWQKRSQETNKSIAFQKSPFLQAIKYLLACLCFFAKQLSNKAPPKETKSTA